MNVDGHCLYKKIVFSLRSEEVHSCYCHWEDHRKNCAAPIVAFFGIALENFIWCIDNSTQEL